MMMTNKTKAAVLAAGLLVVCACAMGQTKARLEVLTTPDRQKADAVASQLGSQGYGPMEVRKNGEKYQVLTKEYESVAEANLAKPRLLGADFLKTRVVTDSTNQTPANEKTVFGDAPSIAPALRLASAPEVSVNSNSEAKRAKLTPELRALDNAAASEEQLADKAHAFANAKNADEALKAADAFIKRFPNSEKLADVKLVRGYSLIKKNDSQSALEQFEAVAREHGEKPEAGEAELRCGFLAIRAKKPDADVLSHFKKVANGQVPSTPEVRLNAMVRCAALYHKARDLETAQAAYQAISSTAADEQVKAYAQMQLAAITMEKAWLKKATFAQARQLCDEFLTQQPKANTAVRATVALMAIETLAYEKKFAQVLEREAAYVKEFKNTREIQLAYYWFAMAHFKTGDTASARAIVNGLLEAKFPTQERFKMVDVTASAQRLLKMIEKAEQDKQQP